MFIYFTILQFRVTIETYFKAFSFKVPATVQNTFMLRSGSYNMSFAFLVELSDAFYRNIIRLRCPGCKDDFFWIGSCAFSNVSDKME